MSNYEETKFNRFVVINNFFSYFFFSSFLKTERESALREAILDVAYYLRRFKFNGYDPRYLKETNPPEKTIFIEFPNPPLKNIQWEVIK